MSHHNKIRITVDIYNRSYTIIGEEDNRHLYEVAKLVDEKMKEIHEMNKSLDTSRLAVLTAVNTMNDYVKLQQDYEKLRESINKEED